jgi:hypothetical protein
MSIWSEIVGRLIPDYNKIIDARDRLKTQYKEEISELELNGKCRLPSVGSVPKSKLGNGVLDKHLTTKEVIENSGLKIGGVYDIKSDNEQDVLEAMGDTIDEIESANFKTRAIRWVLLLLIFFLGLIAICVSISGVIQVA